jgi:hypothetical protein
MYSIWILTWSQNQVYPVINKMYMSCLKYPNPLRRRLVPSLLNLKLWTRYSMERGRFEIISSSGCVRGSDCIHIHWRGQSGPSLYSTRKLAATTVTLLSIIYSGRDGFACSPTTRSYTTRTWTCDRGVHRLNRAPLSDGESPIGICQCVSPLFSYIESIWWKGVYGPFRPPIKTRVPLWLGQSLKLKRKCRIVPPDWFTVGKKYILYV